MTYRDTTMPAPTLTTTLPLTDTTPNPNWFLRARLKTRQLLLIIAIDDEAQHPPRRRCAVHDPARRVQTAQDLEDMLEVRLFDHHARGMVTRALARP